MGEAYTNYGDYYNGAQDDNAICYLTLANKMIHQVNSKAITVAEEVSGMPGLAAPFENGGYGFDYRMAMNIPDYWIKLIKEKIMKAKEKAFSCGVFSIAGAPRNIR